MNARRTFLWLIAGMRGFLGAVSKYPAYGICMLKEEVMMKKLTAALAFAFAFGLMSLCSASISRGELVLGGIQMLADDATVRSIYGEPTRVTRYDMQDLPMYYYGDSFSIVFTSDEKKFIYSMQSSANNGIATPRKITVGSTQSDVINAYGNPTKATYDSKRNMMTCFYDAGYDYFGIAFHFDPKTRTVSKIMMGMFD